MSNLRQRLVDRIHNAPMMSTEGPEKYAWRAKQLAKLNRDLDRYEAAMAEKRVAEAEAGV